MPVQTYTVKGGDNLFSIAGNVYGDQRMFAEIMRLNNLGSGVIRPGMVLRLPAPKPSSAISVSPGLMQKVTAENQFVQQNKRLPSEQEIQQTMASTPVVSTNVDLLRQQRQERNMLMAEQAQQAPTERSRISMAPPAPALTQAQQAEASAFTPEARAAYGTRYGQAQPSQPSVYAQLQRPYAYTKQTEPVKPYSITTPGVMSGIYFRPELAKEPVVSPEMQYSQQNQQQMQQQSNQKVQPTLPQLRSQLETVPIGSESVLGLTRSTLTEQQIPSPASEQATDPAYLRQIGMTPAQINYFIDTLNKPSLTQQDADQFRSVFNIQPGSAFDNLIQQTIINPVAPSTNEEVMGSIWQELQNTGGYGMPMEWIIGGGGGGGGGGQGNKRSPYSIGGTATYGGF
jgi:LysM repeat protein